jgi:NAD+ kinase
MIAVCPDGPGRGYSADPITDNYDLVWQRLSRFVSEQNNRLRCKLRSNICDPMRLGITGNTGKNSIWESVQIVTERFIAEHRQFRVDRRVAAGLLERGLISPETLSGYASDDLSADVDLILSFGGDGTILNTAHEIGARETPILGVNLGHLGFLTHVEFQNLLGAIEQIDSGNYVTEKRMALGASFPGSAHDNSFWALNEFTLQRQSDTGLLTVEVRVDDVFLNTYWADGLIVATPTGSTAYSLALGGPIMAPGSGTILITPMAPHSLTVRPIVIPDAAVVSLRVLEEKAYIFTADGVRVKVDAMAHPIEIRRAAHSVHLVQLAGQDPYMSLRNKLMWGLRKTGIGS